MPTPALRVFASHDWGTGGATHARVAAVVRRLRSHGVEVWFDETHMRGNILDAMCKGIDACDVVLVFVTANYLRKVDQGGDTDNVRREFMYAKDRPEKLLAIRFEEDLPPKWTGPVGMVLGTQLYVDLPDSNADVDPLLKAIQKRTGRTLWKHGAAVAGGVAWPTTHRPPPATPKRLVPPPVRTPPPPPAAGGVRKRIHTLYEDWTGETPPTDRHAAHLLADLFESMVTGGEAAVWVGAPLADKVAYLEGQL